MGNINATPSGGILNIEQVAKTTTNAALGTPAIPLLVNINTSNIVNCVPRSMCMAYAWAMAMLANVMYIMLPSRLNE